MLGDVINTAQITKSRQIAPSLIWGPLVVLRGTARGSLGHLAVPRRGVKRLTAKEVEHAGAGDYADGRGMVLRVERSAAGVLIRRRALRFSSPVRRVACCRRHAAGGMLTEIGRGFASAARGRVGQAGILADDAIAQSLDELRRHVTRLATVLANIEQIRAGRDRKIGRRRIEEGR